MLEGKNEIPITLFEAAESVDSGVIYLQDTIRLVGNELVDDLRELQAGATLRLCGEFLSRYPEILCEALPQSGEPTYYEKRGPEDSQLDVNRSLAEQFNLLRVVDNQKYPAWFEMEGQRYVVKIERK